MSVHVIPPPSWPGSSLQVPSPSPALPPRCPFALLRSVGAMLSSLSAALQSDSIFQKGAFTCACCPGTPP